MLELRTPTRRLRVGLIACDMDRTLTDRRLRVVPSALAALERARKKGVRIVLATGRTLGELERRGGLARRFDGVIVEGGAFYGAPGRLRALQPKSRWVDHLEAWLGHEGIGRRRGEQVLSIARPDLGHLKRYPFLARFNPMLNRDRVDITLRGVDKGRALRRLVRNQLRGATGHRVVFADGENDVSLFRAAHYRIAVSNAVPRLKRLAHEVLPEYGGRAVARFIERRMLHGRTPRP